MRIRGVFIEQHLCLFEGKRELLTFPEYLDVVDARTDIVGFELERALEQELRIIEDS